MAAKRRIDDEALMAAALAEFGTKSYAEASVNTIIERAGISKGSFYYRFPTKYDLYLHVLRTGVAKKWEYIRRAVPPEVATGGQEPDIFDTFLMQSRVGTAFAHQHPEYHQMSVLLSREKGSDLYSNVIRDLGQRDESGLLNAIQSATARGEIRSDLSEEFVVKIISHLLTSFDEVLFSGEDWSLDAANERLEELVTFLREGLSSRS